MTSDSGLVVGIDVGTQGVRVQIADSVGRVVAQVSHSVPSQLSADGWFEQDPDHWWRAAALGLRQATAALGSRSAALAALSITATSGTICLLDGRGRALRPAIMYSDRRATAEAELLNQAGAALASKLGYRFDASFGLPKLLWLQRHEPEACAAARYYAHSGDVLVGRLTGEYGTSDWSQALKSGYDLADLRWPDFIGAELGLAVDRLPRVVSPGVVIGRVTPGVAAATGLPAGLPVVAGMTDGCAAQMAGGASEPGQWLSVLGTTLVIKGVTSTLLRDPAGRFYSHRHPAGMWLPGGASNTGGEVLARRFAGADLAAMDAKAARLTPSGLICYPLERVGERFPFAHPQARGFMVGTAETPEREYTACLEGVAYLERLAYETLEALGAPILGPVRVAGGGARSRVWLQIRADVFNHPLAVPQQVDAAFGAAVLAASASLYADLATAARAMVHVGEVITPRLDAERYAEPYRQFVAACRERGYLVAAPAPSLG
ncbi:MAG: carbohydrate kinase [Kouleothrix sp.]|nr:carbohydrate kinase [Kouleothrix sp.]